MSNPIPPFVCSTPPPIDCIVDTPPIAADDDDFGDFAAVDDQFEASSLPVTPVHITKLPDDNARTAIHSTIPPSPESQLNFITKDDDEHATVDIKSFEQDKSSLSSYAQPTPSKVDLKMDLPYMIEANSPPPLDFEPADDDLTPCDDLDNDDEPDEFPVDDVGKYDDNISLPSLKFDSLSNISKSTTPVSDELTKSNHEDIDSISAFQSIPTGDLEEEAIVVTVEESSVIERSPAVEEIVVKSIPFDEITISKEEPEASKNSGNLSVLRQSSVEEDKKSSDYRQFSKGHDEDFTEFEAYPAVPLQSDTQPVQDEPPDDDFQPTEPQESGDFAFEADFSQFSSFEPVTVEPPVKTQIAEKPQLTERSSLDDLDADDFDDFQDFAVATQVVDQRKLSLEESTAPSTLTEAQETFEVTNDSDEDGDDDDFGEFSEVIESNASSIPSSNSGFNLSNLNEKLKPILEMMFPFSNAMEDETECSVNELKQLTTSTTINQIDTAKALEYQWSNSEVRHSLIKSLGVDSRNILYGEKWNSSMPRFAANLSFNPLEPMKSEKVAAASGSSSSSTIDYRKRSDSLTASSTTSKADVPAVEFDWNSSGLVNPLDGVKEILHERTIETIHTPQLGESYPPIDQQSNSALNSNNNIYDSNKQLRRFVDGEAVSTPIEFKSNEDASATISTTTTTTAAVTTATQPTAAASATTTAALPDDYIDITCGDFRPGVLETNIDTVIANSQALNHNTHAAKYQESSKTDLETELQHSGVVTTSTYAGPLKETHIFTPSKSESTLSRSTSTKTPRTSESKCPIDFDYEIAAAGIIIDETVVKKEYRDVEYNPGFGLKYREETEYNRSPSPDIERNAFGLNGPTPMHSYLNNEPPNKTQQFSEKPSGLDDFSDFISVVSEKVPDKKTPAKAYVPNNNSLDDEFSDFQSVPAPVAPTIVPSATIPSSVVATESKTSPSHWQKLKETERSSSGSRTGTPVSLCDEMILSPAILLPQSIQVESKPKIEWPEPGINPEELARIEELFPQPKIGSNKPSPSHSVRSQQQQQQQQQKHQHQQSRSTPQPGAEDDDWSDFVSVPAPINHIQSISQQFQKRHVSPAKSASDPNDEEWSDFVSSAPPPPTGNHMRQSIYPQFNSAAWQNANFYNNPMSAYASPPTSFYYQPPPPQTSQQQQQKQNLSNNLVPNLSNVNNNTATNNNIINNNSINQYLINNQASQSHHHHHHNHQQHIQMMRDFSSSSPMDGGSLPSHLAAAAPAIHHQYAMQTAAGYGYGSNRTGIGNLQHHGKSSQFGSGSSKVAPSISLIPDLGFAAPTHTSFISVPKNSFITKK